MTYSNGMTHTEARRFVHRAFVDMGMTLPKKYVRGGNQRPTRIDLIVSNIRAIRRFKSKECYDSLAVCFHNDPMERIAAKVRLAKRGVVLSSLQIDG